LRALENAAKEIVSDRRALQSALKGAINAVLTQHGVAARSEYPTRFSMTHRVKTQTPDLHEYLLEVELENLGTRRINNWHVDVEIPTPLLKTLSHVGYVKERSDRSVSVIRFTHELNNGAIFPSDSRLMQISYRMTHELYYGRGQLFDQAVSARAYVEGAMAADIKKTVGELQNF
jgi:hypothetical protein